MITPFLWFNHDIQDMIDYYQKIFKDFEVLDVNNVNGQILIATLKIQNQKVILLNGGDFFILNEAFSFSLSCVDQDEIDYYHEHLSYCGEIQDCGWVKDKFGLSWQIVPKDLNLLLFSDDENIRNDKYMKLRQMKKIIISELN